MNRTVSLLAALAAAGGLAAPALAQSGYPYPQQPYPQYPQPQYPQGYPQQGYQQQGNPIQQVIDQLLGNRYNVTDRTAVQRCASAAVQQTSAQYRPQGYPQQGYNPYGQPQYAPGYGMGARVTAVTNVERRPNGLRVSGIINSGRYGQMDPRYTQQGGSYGMNSAYAVRSGDLTFRCNVDYRGAVTDVRVRQNAQFRRY